MDYVIISVAILLPGIWIIIMEYIEDKRQCPCIAYCNVSSGDEKQNVSSPFHKSIIVMMICAQNHFMPFLWIIEVKLF